MPLVLDGTTGFNLPTGANVGIGTTNPDEQLHVHESSSSTEIKVSSGNGYATAQLDAAASAGAGVRFYHGGVQRARIETRPSGTQLDFIMGTTGSGRKLTLDADGNIALNWSDNKTLEMYYDNSYHMGLMFDAASRDVLIRNKAGDSAGDIRFQTDNGTGTLSTKMVILANGYVGIGATSAYSASTDFEVKAVDPKIVINNTGQRAFGLLASGTKLHIRDESDNQDLVTITEGGNVGIGYPGPNEKLHVNGYIEASSGFKLASHPVLIYDGFDGGYATQLGSTGTSTLNATQIFAGGGLQATFKGGNVGIGTTNGDVTSDGTASRTYVGIIGSGNRGRLNLGSTAANGADSGSLSFVNGANELGSITVDTNSGVQNAGKMYITSTDDILVRSISDITYQTTYTNSTAGDHIFKSYNTEIMRLSAGILQGASNAEIKTSPIRKHSNTISTNTTIDSSENAIASGPISVATGVTLTINGNMTVV